MKLPSVYRFRSPWKWNSRYKFTIRHVPKIKFAPDI